ncbi:probable LRR receptor-like serine/threonine-protein kinase At1g67720 isoform X1 [Salvia miltiorrhiza]|uniref:probable LRR receptor-like serine/threonine-protein kinase At1g67720 isoform X1 n=1 Tax=Salvia miltiorrhiza TaxID=226208 RepID=UPI0025AD0BA9|nr:probable LRR receptor-like serine/threonine-protein kinase At1g67720 isoform X1 [Salvia miltiorrhiza]
MSACVFLLWLVSIPLSIQAARQPRDYLISCGAKTEIKEGALKYVPDSDFIATGNTTTLKRTDILPRLRTLRFFPNANARKHCYSFPVIRGARYLVKTIYFYGKFDGGRAPPVFDQIIDGTKWSTVNTTEDFAGGGSSFYEAVVAAQNKVLSICLARNQHTPAGSSPFISSLEVHYLESSVYNSTNFDKAMLMTVARSRFGSHDDIIISYPDDIFNRFWEPYKDESPFVTSHWNVTTTSFWNIPPQKAFASALTTSRGKTLTLNWPPFPLSSGLYYIAFYFQDNRSPSPYSWRVFDVQVNGHFFFQHMNVTEQGQGVVGTNWPLSGQLVITLSPAPSSPVGPLINAAELLQLLPFGNRTLTRDAVAMEELKKEVVNPPEDWGGDPCLPIGHSWGGVYCTVAEPFRVVSLNLSGYGLSGKLSPSIARLTGLRHIWLGDNKFSGVIPDLSPLKALETLHLENNQFEGPVPPSLGQLPNLQQVFLQNNKLNSSVPEPLTKRDGLSVRLS